jgi:hypothetical protein
MKFPYLPAAVKVPIPSLGGSLARPRPIIAACVIGPTGSKFIDGLLDTGAGKPKGTHLFFIAWPPLATGKFKMYAVHLEGPGL